MFTTEYANGGGFLAEVRSAVRLRAALLVIGVLAVQLGFILSYVGAFHDPKPRDIPLAVVAPEEARAELVQSLEGLPGDPLDVSRTPDDQSAARALVENRTVDGALIVDPSGTTDVLLVASGGGQSVSDALAAVLTEAEAARQRGVEVTDIVPAGDGDNRGLSPFYLVVGWCVGGYLCAAALAISAGARPSNPRRAVIRLLVLLVYAAVAGLGGAVIAGPVLGALPGSVLGLSAVGALVVFATGAATLALQGLLGVVGIGLAILLVVVLGNPSAGGAYGRPLLPPFWRDVGPALIPGPGTFSVRSVAYFDSVALTGPLLVLGAWAVGGVLLTMIAAVARARRVPRAYS